MAEYFWPPEIEGGGGGGAPTGAVVLAAGSATAAIVFTTPILVPYAVVVSVSNLIDTLPIFLQAIITAKSTTGFSVLFNTAPDTANYNLEYIVAAVN